MKNLTFLIVDDEFLNRRLMVDYLKKYGRCHQAGNGQEALLAVSEAYGRGEPFDMVFLDLVMPSMDGLAFLEEVRRIEADRGVPAGKGIGIIVTSALNDSSSIQAAEGFHVLDYLVKPFSREAVEECARKHLGL